MTITEAIERADELKPNQFSAGNKIGWLSTLEGQLVREIFERGADNPGAGFAGYSDSTPMGTELLAPAPYDLIYVDYLHAMIDFYNAEFTKYQNQKEKFNADFLALQAYWIRNHAPLGVSALTC